MGIEFKGTVMDVVILSAVRTAIGDFGGALKTVAPIALGVATAEVAIERSGLEKQAFDYSCYGNVLHTEPKDMYLSRAISIGAGLSVHAPSLTLNRLCGSGLQAIISGIQSIALKDSSLALCGGSESMSRAGYLIPSNRWGQKMGDAQVVDMMLGVLNDPFGHGHMGVTAENVAEKYSISREKQDEFALESHRRAASAINSGKFKEQIVPIEINTKGHARVFDVDEHVRDDISISDLENLRTVFKKDGTVTAGNASGINDGAASLVLMDAKRAEKQNLSPMARVLSYAVAGVEPKLMGIGPVPAMQRALEIARININDLDIIESNEAFAAQACAVSEQLGADPKKINPNGGAIALGHPIGASGAIITTKLLYELKLSGKKYGAATMCIGGGQGIALLIENLLV